MDAMHKSATYSMLSEPKSTGDLGSMLTDEKDFFESLKQMLEEHFQSAKLILQPETFIKIIALATK
jgi:DNA replication initiation complex subunit (GINS family)